MALRILFSIVLFISILYFPIWSSLFLAFAGIIYFPLYLEAALLLLLSDLLFGASGAGPFGSVFATFIFAIIILAGTEVFKKRLRFYT